MKIGSRNIVTLYAILGLISWLLLISIDLLNVINEYQQGDKITTIPIPKVVFIMLFVFSVMFYRRETGKHETNNIIELTWKIFVTGLSTTIASLLTRYLLAIAQYKPPLTNKLLTTVIYDINIALVVIFLTSSFIVWKKLVLYQKSRKLIKLWKAFELGIYISLLFTFSPYNFFDPVFNFFLAVFIIAALILSVNLKWVAYLNYKQKWKTILLLVLVSLYFWYFFVTITNFSNRFSLYIDLSDNITILALFAFCFTYAVFSILVLLFNLPTSSVFEQKLEEVINFQKLSQTANTDKEEEQIYEILLESSVSAVIANAAWLEISNYNGAEKKILYHKIGKSKIKELETQIGPLKVDNFTIDSPLKSLKKSQFVVNLKDEDYKSALIFPLVVKEKHYGTLYLLKDLKDGFNREMIEIIRSFTNQASISIENYQLIKEAIENERYKEELEIAKRVQGGLLPEMLDKNDDFDIIAYSKAAAEVGGDYYDTYRIGPDKIALIIGDVSGKGTSAAFHMAQMKGIFQSLSQLDLPVKAFLEKANHAVSKCLDKKSLITISYFIINSTDKTIQFSRAGHCPTLYYTAKEKKARFFETNGLGLGILRDSRFNKFVEVYEIQYEPGDLLFLYTDGITEAKDANKYEFGYDKLLDNLNKYADKSAEQIQSAILDNVYNFCGKNTPDDDFTTLIVKFK